LSVAAWLALRDLSVHRRQAVALGTVFAMAVTAFVALGSYRQTLVRDYRPARNDQLVIQETQSFAEFYGSRLSPEIGTELGALGFAGAVAEIHAIVGTSLQDAVLLKGVDLERYPELDSFFLRAGRGLEPGDPPRRAMIGTRLAERLEAGPGDTIRLRGRPFEVVGVFESGSYTENEAWVPLAGAQELLGWGQDVSLYVVTDDGRLTPGQQLLDGVSVARRGELWSTFPRQWDGLMALIGTVTQAIGLAAAFSLAAMLWRLAWRRRRQIAVLRSLGFSRTVFAIYLAVQGASVAFAGGACGVLCALALLRWVRPTLAGVSLRPHLTAELLMSTGVWLGFLTLISVVVPVWALGRRRVAELMSGE
jgi:ABC-type lipoprotein release transport system permease subunit